MRIATVYFDNYEPYAKILELSVKRTMGIDIEMHRLPAPSSLDFRTTNNIKLQKWVSLAEQDKEDLILCDADLFFRKPIDPFDGFDIGITEIGYGNIPFNAGIIFLSGNKSRSFMRCWADIDSKMYTNTKFWQPYSKKYAGMNQASLGYIYEQKIYPIHTLPCSIYNACRLEHWQGDPSIVHVKSKLRRHLQGADQAPKRTQHIIGEFRALECDLRPN